LCICNSTSRTPLWRSSLSNNAYSPQDYWYQASQDPTGSFRFLTTPKTFCIIAFNKPSGGQVTVDAGGVVLPIQKGDRFVLLGPGLANEQQSLEWGIDGSGVLTIMVPQGEVDQVDFAWAFQVTYSGA
jgi:alpha-L-fucosidase